MTGKNIITLKSYYSPCGILTIGSYDRSICLSDWQKCDKREKTQNIFKRILNVEFKEGSSDIIEKAIIQLDEYFEGKRKDFELPIKFIGTDFQKSVWNELLAIPYGITSTYSKIADAIEKPRAVRAVANAIGANPIAIIVPCHRVIGSDSSLTGYRSGLDAKRILLDLENPTSSLKDGILPL